MRPRTALRAAVAGLLPAITILVLGRAEAAAQAAPLKLPVVVDGQAQVVPALQDSSQWIREELWVETTFDTDGDGKPDRMHVAVVRPGQTAGGLKVPVIYETSPYFSGTATITGMWDVKQEVGEQPPPRVALPPVRARIRPGISGSLVSTWVPRGFAVVHSESPGTGLSQGCPTVGGPNEELAPKAVIDWLNGRARGFTTADGNEEVMADWTTGKVGMTGTSYNGTLPLAAATTGVEGLEAIIPVSPNTSYYRYYRSNGLVRSPGGYLGEDMQFLFDFINSGNPDRRDWCATHVRDGELAANDRQHGDWNDFWAARDYQEKLGGVKAAVLIAHGFNDWNVVPEHSVRVYEMLEKRGVTVQAYFHQGGHGGSPPLPMMNRWFTRFLYGVENGVENGPKAWIVRENADRGEPTPYADYPDPASAYVTLHPLAGGVRMGGLSTSAMPGQGTEMLVDNFSFSGETLAQAEWTDHRLLYATEPLAEDLRISGTPRVTVRLASSKPAANLTVYLVQLPFATGRNANPALNVITRGWADLQNHASLSHGEPLVPGRFYDMTFEIEPDDQVIPAGKRLVLMLMSSDRDFTLWPRPGTELTFDLDHTSIDLPVVGGLEALRRALGPASR